MKTDKIKVGQIVYAKPINDAARYDKNLITCIVISVGNKYFQIKKISDINYSSFRNQFYIDGLKEKSANYYPDYRIYLSKEEVEEEINRPLLIKQIMEICSKLNNNQLKQLIAKY